MLYRSTGGVLAACGLAILPATIAPAETLPPLEVSPNGRFFVQKQADGTPRPFFWLGDTAWGLYKGSTEEVDLYLDTRQQQGFNLIQGPTFEWQMPGTPDDFGNTTDPLAYDTSGGNTALIEPFMQKIDYIVDAAAARGMYVALVPIWSDGMASREQAWGTSHTEDDLRQLGETVAARYANRTNVIWMSGGESVGEGNSLGTTLALGEGLQAGSGGQALITVHPSGDMSSGEVVHNQSWLDFNMVQTGHSPEPPTYTHIGSDWNRNPRKPTLEAEITYEGWDITPDVEIEAHQVRTGAYWSVFAGGAGFTYGHADVYLFRDNDNNYNSIVDWADGLSAEAGNQMAYLRRLMESRPMMTRLPDQGLVLSGQQGGDEQVQAMRDGTPGGNNASYLMAYLPSLRDVAIDTDAIAGDLLDAWWYDPRTGDAILIEAGFANTGSYTPTLPATAGDWVLVIDDAGAGFDMPGVGFDLTIPEPGTAALAGAGLALLLRRTRREV